MIRGEAPGTGLRRGYRQPSPGKVGQGSQAGAGKEPEQRAVGINTERDPRDVLVQSRQQRPAEPDHRAAAQPLPVPRGAVAQYDADALVGVEILLVSDVSDQFLVRPPPYVGEIDRIHERFPPDAMICRMLSGTRRTTAWLTGRSGGRGQGRGACLVPQFWSARVPCAGFAYHPGRTRAR